MHDDVTLHFGRGKHEQAVKVEVALAGAAAPARFLVADGDAVIEYTDLCSIMGNKRRQLFFCKGCQSGQFFISKRDDGRLFLYFVQLLFNPGCLAADDFVYALRTNIWWAVDMHPSVGLDADGDGLGTAAYNCILK